MLLLLFLFVLRQLLLLVLFLVFLAALVSHACSSFAAESEFRMRFRTMQSNHLAMSLAVQVLC